MRSLKCKVPKVIERFADILFKTKENKSKIENKKSKRRHSCGSRDPRKR